MTAFDADYFDGVSSRRVPVRVEVAASRVIVVGDGVAIDITRDDLRVKSRLGRTPVRIDLANGGLLVTPDAADVDAALGLPPEATLAHMLETHARAVAVAIGGVIAAAYFAYDTGIPWLADRIVQAIPEQAEASIGPDALAAMDYLFKPTEIEAERREALEYQFLQLVEAAGLPAGTRLEFQNSRLLGPNAFALPGGVVVVTDELVRLLKDRELVAVFAHELGHVKRRHSLRLLVGSSLHALLSFAVLGDAGALASIAGTAPQVFLQAGYSRDAEREADAYAIELLQRAQRPATDFADALKRIDRITKDMIDGDDRSYVSTHPGIDERIRRAEEAR